MVTGLLKLADTSKVLKKRGRKRIEVPPSPAANFQKRKLPEFSEPALSRRTRLRIESLLEFVRENKLQLLIMPPVPVIQSHETYSDPLMSPVFTICTREHGNEDINSTSLWNVFTDGSRTWGRVPRAGLGVYYTRYNGAFGLAKRVAENTKLSYSFLTSTGERRVIELKQLDTDALAMELLAILEAILLVESLCDCLPHQLFIHTDSLDSMQLLREFQREPGVFTRNPYTQLLETIVSVARTSGIQTFHLHKVKAHSGIFGNEVADRLAKIGSGLPVGASGKFNFTSLHSSTNRRSGSAYRWHRN